MPMHTLQKTNIIGVELNRFSSAEIATNPSTKEESQSQQQTPPPQPRSGRRIRFNSRVAVKETIHVNEYTDEEIFRAWYRKADFSKMKTSYAYIVQLLAAGRYQGDTDDMTSRGLEYRHREGAMKRKANKLNALYAVLDEQERQWSSGYENDETLRNVYLQHSTHCRHNAHAMGQKDEDECRRLCAETSDDEGDDDMSMDSDASEYSMDLMQDNAAVPKKSKQKSKFSRFFHKKDTAKSDRV